MSTTEFYLKQATQNERDAAEAVLENVRERALRSALAWRKMADRLTHTETMRTARDAEKLAALGDAAM